MLSRSSSGAIQARRSPVELGSFFFEPIEFHVELTDLAVQFLYLGLVVERGGVFPLFENPDDIRRQPPFPLAD
jgi:hypothetical protein